MRKRSIMCTVMLVIMIIFSNANGLISHASGGDDDFGYGVSYDGNVTITRYNGTANGVVIPATIAGKPVIGFGEYVFKGNKDITSVTIPSSIRNVPENAFLLCSNLKTVTIQGSTYADGDYKGVDNIEARAFKYCTSLTTVNLPASVTRTNGLNTWYDGLSTIKAEAFLGCTSLKDITLPDSVNNIYGNVFQDCTSLETITLPKKLTAINQYMFKNCKNLENITIPDSVTGIYTAAFARCTSLRTIIIPNNVTMLGHDVFQGCSGLTSITIPNKVESIGMYTFSGCKNLASVTFSDSSTLKSISHNAFSGCAKLVSIKLPNSVKIMGKKVFYGCSGLETVENMPNTIDSIAEGTFYNCTKLKNIAIPSATKTIGFNAFRDCKALESIAISNVTSIASQGFYGCSSLNNVIIPSAMTSIGDSVFSGCTGLINITLPSTVKTIGGSAFSRCSSLTNIDTMLTNIETIGNNGFGNCTGLTTITIPAGVTSVGNDAFLGCTEVTSVKFKGNETSIGYEGFYGCVKLETVELPTNIESISDKVFHGCKALKTIIIPETVKSIGQSAFYDCEALTQITIPDGITSIGRYAFKECESLTEIILPSSVNNIAYWAFKDCSLLAKVTILGRDTSIGAEAISGCDADLEIHGYGGSTAQTYADAQTIIFVDISVIPNNPPTICYKIGNITDRKVGIAVSVNLDDVFEDMDDDALTYLSNIGELSEVSELRGTWWSYTPVASDVGKEIIVTITANDGKGGSITDEFTISNITDDVIIPPNNPPTISHKIGNITDRKVGIAVSVNLENVFEDMDDDALTYLSNIGELSEVSEVSEVRGTWWTYTPIASDVGKEIIVIITANDGKGGSITDEFTISNITDDVIIPPNNPPTVAHKIGNIADRKVGIAVSVNLEDVFKDMDDDTLTYLSNIGELRGTWWSYTPIASDVGKEIIVIITANDGKGGSISDEFKISNITADVIIPPYTPPIVKDKVEISVTTRAVTTFGGSDGEIIVTTSGAITCEFSKDNGIHWQNKNIFKNLISGIYKVLARNKNDINNVSEVIVTRISQPAKPTKPSSSGGGSSKYNKETNVFKSDDKITIYNNTKVGMDVFKQLKEKKQRELTLKGDIFSITFSGGGEVKEMPVKEIDLDLSLESPNEKDIKKLTGHKDIVNLYFTYHGELPMTGKVTVNIGDKYKNKKMYLYYYNKDNNSLELYGLLNSDGKVTFSIDHCSDYVLSEDLILKSNPFKENMDTLAYIRGRESGDFGADNNITRGETATLLNNILSDSNTSSNKEFSDIDMWAKEAILQLANLGYINGYKDGTFKPNNNITRAEFVKIITNIIDTKDTQSFRDENLSDIKGNWAEKDIKVCYELGLINGFGGEFSPDNYISRAEAVTIVNKLINREINDNNKVNPFEDLSKEHWAYLQIMSAIK